MVACEGADVTPTFVPTGCFKPAASGRWRRGSIVRYVDDLLHLGLLGTCFNLNKAARTSLKLIGCSEIGSDLVAIRKS